MPKLSLNGTEVDFEPGMTLLQVCEANGVEIPRFCYHERLSIAGNCRMCLIEMEPSPKPVASCAMPAGDGMVIRTNTPLVEKARKGVMEFILINHPLDCPICDQGGECDLQDQAMAFGADKSRYAEAKRAVEDKDFGPLIKTAMTRCIHCTRCIRFATEVAGVEELGATGRGEDMEVGTYVGKALTSELSGNMIDLCPVGALTSKPYAFMARSWELKNTETVDVLDAVGSSIRVDSRGTEVMRVLPRLNDQINEEWISDKTRFACDGLSRQRLDRPYVRVDGRLREASWDEAFGAVVAKLQATKADAIAAIAGDLACCESMMGLKEIMTALKSPHTDCRQDGAALDPGCRAGYIFNSKISGIDEADLALMVGVNPRLDAPVVNARLRSRYLKGGFSPALLGPQVDLTYPLEYLGDDPKTLQKILASNHHFSELLEAAHKPMLILGIDALMREDGAAILSLAREISENFGIVKRGWNGFNILQRAAARVGGLDLGFVPGEKGLDTAGIINGAMLGNIEVVYLLGADEVDTSALTRPFVIYQGHHGDAGAQCADVILPGAAYTEKDATYVNTEGRVQRAFAAVQPPGDARSDWTIARALAGKLGQKSKYDDLEGLRALMFKTNSVFGNLDAPAPAQWDDFGVQGPIKAEPLSAGRRNFYMTDPISRASETMAECMDAFLASKEGKTGTDG